MGISMCILNTVKFPQTHYMASLGSFKKGKEIGAQKILEKFLSEKLSLWDHIF